MVGNTRYLGYNDVPVHVIGSKNAKNKAEIQRINQ